MRAMNTKKMVAYFFPHQITLSHRERLLSSAGVFVTLLAIAVFSHRLSGAQNLPFLAASIGASTMLVLAIPHSAFSQPWPLVGGHFVSALVGITCARLVPDLHLAAALAVSLSVVAMFYLRCLHPAGGGTALLAVIGGEGVRSMGYAFAFNPVLLGALLLLAMALTINRLIPGRRYPLGLSLSDRATPAVAQQPQMKLAFDESDLVAALRDMDGYIDVAGEDLKRIYALATLHARRRQLGDLRCADILTREAIAVGPATPLDDVWALFRTHRIRGVPVIDAQRRVVGMLAMADFLKIVDWRMCEGLRTRLRVLFGRQAKPAAAQVMTTEVVTVREETHVVDAFLIFAGQKINHLPVVAADGRLVGIVTRLDLLSALLGDKLQR